jgi:hypothetical protein
LALADLIDPVGYRQATLNRTEHYFYKPFYSFVTLFSAA